MVTPQSTMLWFNRRVFFLCAGLILFTKNLLIPAGFYSIWAESQCAHPVCGVLAAPS